METLWSYPGSRWWKFDFHTHTPASKDTIAWQKAIGTPDELTPETWLLKYMEAEIDCVAITDHNSGEWIDKLKSAYIKLKDKAEDGSITSKFRELHIFPGVELSVQGGIHILAIFDPAKDSQTISDLIAVVGYDGARGDSDGVTRESAVNVVKAILDRGGIAIPAHVDRKKGLLQLQEGTRRSFFDSNTVKQVLEVDGLLALEWLDPKSKPPQSVEKISLTFSKVIGSDCHSFKGAATPGSRYTWIKMAYPNIEGLRLALLDGQGISVKRNDENDNFYPFTPPEHFIENIEIRNAQWMGQGNPTEIKLNPYFNAIVGGRGTGKSTIVHALRIAYGRDHELDSSTEAGSTFKRFKKTAKNKKEDGGLRKDTEVLVKVNRDGTSYFLSWATEGEKHSVKELNAESGLLETSNSQVITSQRFPIRLFSQGQIAALAGENQQALLKVIDDAAGTVQKQFEFEEAVRSFLATRAQMLELDVRLKGKDSLDISLQDVIRKLQRFEGTDHALVLKSYQQASQQILEIDKKFAEIVSFINKINDLAKSLKFDGLALSLFPREIDKSAIDIIKKLEIAISNTRSGIEECAEKLNKDSDFIKTEINNSDWYAEFSLAVKQHDALKEDLQKQGVSDPGEYDRLVQEKQKIEEDIAKLELLQEQKASLKEKAKSQLNELKFARRRISEIRQEFLDKNLVGNSYVKINLIPYGRDIRYFEASLRDLLGCSDNRFADDFYQEAQDGCPPKGLVAELEKFIKDQEQNGGISTESYEKYINDIKTKIARACEGEGGFGGRFNSYLKTEAVKKKELMDHVLCWFPEDGLRVEYSRKGNGLDFQSIGQASAGQRAAAMLAFLLAHGDEPLILDQPEDDLDNHLIYDLVVRQIRSNKLRRQLIIITHNPNIVVNGDAELIYVLDFNNQCYIKHTGSLQDQNMRSNVCQVMEGGKEAFERRYQRLGR